MELEFSKILIFNRRSKFDMKKFSKAELVAIAEQAIAEQEKMESQLKAAKAKLNEYATKKKVPEEDISRRNIIRALAKTEANFDIGLSAIDKLRSCIVDGKMVKELWEKAHVNDLPVIRISFEDWTPALVKACLDEEPIFLAFHKLFRTFRDSKNNLSRSVKNEVGLPNPPAYDFKDMRTILFDICNNLRDDLPEGWEAATGVTTRSHEKRRVKTRNLKKKSKRSRSQPSASDKGKEEEEEGVPLSDISLPVKKKTKTKRKEKDGRT